MKTYKIVYTFNRDLQRIFIEVNAEDRQSAIESLKNTGRKIGLEYKISSCRVAQVGKIIRG